MNGSDGRRLPYTMLILALLVFTAWIAVVPAGADSAVVTRDLPDSVEQNETFVVILTQSGFYLNIGVVWEVLPEDFEYVNGSYTGGAPDRVIYDPSTRTLEMPFAMETSIAYSVNASSYDQTAEFSGTWRALDSQMNKTNGTVGGDIMVVVSGTPPAPVISSSTHTDEEIWYCNRNATFTWTTPPDASGIACYSYTIDDSSTTTPDTVCDTTENSKSYTNLEYSIRYFHVRAKDNDDNWGFADHYRVKIENCTAKDGCYAYDTGCEDRDYYCSEGSCTYTYSNRHTDYYEDLATYCNGDEVWQHRLFHDFYCEAGTCTEHTSWANNTFIENCSDSDGWKDTGNTSWVEDQGNECKEKEQKEQEYRDYTCLEGSCDYNVTDTQWIDTGNERNKPDGTDCGEDYYDAWVSYCNGDEVWQHRQFHDFYCEAGNCTEHTSWANNTFIENCSDSDGWMDTGNTSWIDNPGNECKEKEQKEQEYRDYTCSAGSCVYEVTETRWIDTGNERNKPDGTDCGEDYYDAWVSYCNGDEVWQHKQFHDFYCEAGNCTEHTSWANNTFIENCSDSDGWVDTGNTSWIEDPGNECKEKEQKEQEYQDYTCSAGSCVYEITETRWIDTGNERNKEDGTNCGEDYYDAWVTYCNEDEVWQHRQSHDFYCEAGNCTEHTSWENDTFVENCNDSDGWVDTGNTSWIDDPGNECKEKEQKEQEYRDYTCSDGNCDYNVTDTQWIDTGNERERIRGIDARPDSCRMNISEERQFSAIATLTAGGTEDVTLNASWSSSNTSVLEHLDGGKFKAKSKGIAEVIANYCNKSDRSIVKVNISENFDTGTPANPYPSISGAHTGTIKPNVTIEVSTLYTYPCPGTGGHTEYARIWNNTGLNATTTWKGYVGDWHNISFNPSFTLLANKTYNYTIITGSYPQIHHESTLPTANGWINCTQFIDANGKEYTNWIPAIRLDGYNAATAAAVSVTRDLPDEAYPGDEIEASLTQFGFFITGFVTETLPEGFTCTGLSPSSGGTIEEYDRITNILKIGFGSETTITYIVETGTAKQITGAEFSGTWGTINSIGDKIYGDVEGDTTLTLAEPPTPTATPPSGNGGGKRW